MTTQRKKKLARRLFLKAVGAGIAAPLAMRMGSLAQAEAAKAPVRLFVYYLPHGWPVEQLDTVLDPLAPYAQQVTRVEGLRMNDGATNHAAIRAALTGFSEGGAGLAVTVDNGVSPVAITVAVPAIDPVDVSLTLRGFSASTFLAEPSGTPFSFMSSLSDGVPFVTTVTHESFSLNYLFGTLNQVPDFIVDDGTGDVSFVGFFDGGLGMGVQIDNSGIIADVEIGLCISCPALADQVLDDLCSGFAAAPPGSTQGLQALIDETIDTVMTNAIICDDGEPGAGSQADCLEQIESLLR